MTGGLGVIGSCFVHSRLDAGDEVDALDSAGDARHALNGRKRFAHPENTAERQFRHLCHQLGGVDEPWQAEAGIDRILHAAASTGIPYSATAPLDDWSRNVDGTIEVLEAVRAKPTPLVVLSSVKPYALSKLFSIERGDCYKLSGFGVDESYQLSPEEPYAASKAAQSLIAQAYARSYDLPIVVFRCSNLFGPAACHGPRHGWATWLCIQAALGWPIEIQGSGKQTRDLLFASDVESAALAAFQALEAGDVERGQIYNLGGGVQNMISVLQLVEMLHGMGARFETRQAPGRAHEDMLFVTDCSNIQRDLGWERKVPLREGVARVYEWAVANRDALATVYAEHGPK